MDLWLLLGGIAIGSGGATAVHVAVKWWRARQLPGISPALRQALEGVWVEHVPDAPGRSISVGRIYTDPKKGQLVFDGTNYGDDLRPYCYWTTFSSGCFEQEGRFNYSFRATLDGSLDKIYYGSGMIFFSHVEDNITVDNGYYVSINVDPKQMTHTMFKPSVLQHKHAYQKIYTPDQLATILRNAGIPLPLAPAEQRHAPLPDQIQPAAG